MSSREQSTFSTQLHKMQSHESLSDISFYVSNTAETKSDVLTAGCGTIHNMPLTRRSFFLSKPYRAGGVKAPSALKSRLPGGQMRSCYLTMRVTLPYPLEIRVLVAHCDTRL